MKSTVAQKEWKQKNYQNKKEYFLARQRKRRECFKRILEVAKNKPCIDCGHIFQTCAMDLHHRNPEEKIRDVANLQNFSSEKKLREEIDKCDVICSNCHRVRSYKEQVEKLRGIAP